MPSFTLRRSKGKLLQFVTEIGICQAFDPAAPVASRPPVHPFKGIWDTGATGSVITDKVVAACNLAPIGVCQVQTAGGSQSSPVYLVTVTLPNHVGVSEVRVTQGALGDGADVLIGMDIITLGDFAVTHPQGNTVFSFRIPSEAELDFVAEHRASVIATPIKLPPGVGRNSQCPCGSGKKYKHCCGKS